MPRGGCSRWSASVSGRVSEPAGPRHRRRGAGGRPPAGGGGGRRQEPRPALRGRRHRPQSPAHVRTLAGGGTRRPGLRTAVARPPRQPAAGAALRRARPGAERARRRTARPGHPRRRNRTSSACSRTSGASTRPGRSATPCSTSALVAGIGNMWRAESLWQAGISPWRHLGELSDAELRGVLEVGGDADAPVGRDRPRGAERHAPRRDAVSPVPDADPLARPGRREPHRLLVPLVPARPDPGQRGAAANLDGVSG